MGLTVGKIRFFLGVFIALFIAVIAVSATIGGKRRGQGVVEPKPEEKGGALFKMDAVHYSGTRAGRVVWELDAARAYREDGGATRLETVRLLFHGAGERFTLTSREALYEDAGGGARVTAGGGVALSSDGGLELKASELVYSASSGIVSVPGFAELKTVEMNVTGYGMAADMDKGRVTFSRDVRAVLDGGGFGARPSR